MAEAENTVESKIEKADSSPTKLFFSRMLTRDIEVDDAILDLIDNCVDGAMRLNKSSTENDYHGFHVTVDISESGFQIFDNCGGIPHDTLINVALRMGRLQGDARDSGLATVGVYGIGMKRAIFKLGEEATLYTQTTEGAYKVHYSEAWLNSDTDWTLNVESVSPSLPKSGTKITIEKLRSDIASLFSPSTTFIGDLINKISKHFSYIMEKGFEISVNDTVVSGKNITLLLDDGCFSGKGIAPFIYKTNIDGIEVFLAVGLYTDLPSDEEIETSDSTATGRASSEKAGWTIICNDRVILYADKTINTGWGEADVPKYHTQFVSIAGIVTFRSNDPIKLPVSTTKRSMQGDSTVWLNIKNVMRKGLKIFTDYTNNWKTNTEEEREHRREAKPNSVSELITKIPKDKWKTDRGDPNGQKYIPDLPSPEKRSDARVIRYSRPLEQITSVSQILFDTPDQSPAIVGAKCFDSIFNGTFVKAKKDE